MLRPKVLPDEDEVTFSELESSPNYIERDNNFSERAHSVSHERSNRAKSHDLKALYPTINSREVYNQLEDNNEHTKRSYNANQDKQKDTECTFMPLTNPRTKSTMRSIKQFVEDQTNYLDSTRAKVSSIFKEQQNKLLRELQSKPTIIFKSKSLAKKRPNYALPAHQRLYSFKKNTDINKCSKNMLNNSKKPITTNAQPAVFSVYKDALKRHLQQRKETSPTALKKIMSPESEKQIAKKLHKQIEFACMQNNINAYPISYDQLKTILNQTGFTNTSKKNATLDNEEEETLIKDMWSYITSNNKEANISSVETFLNGIINVKPLEKATMALPKNIQTKYQKFSVNRVSSMLTKRRSSEQSNFNPVINATSYRLAKKRKVKQLQVSSHDKSCSKKETKELSITAQREQDECTFTPQLNNFSRRLSSFSYQKDRCLDLYNQAKSDLKKRVDRSTEEVEFEKSKNELTFTPTLFNHKQRQSPSISTNTSLIKSTNDAKKDKEVNESKDAHASKQNNGRNSPIVKQKKEKALTNRNELDAQESSDMNVKSSLFLAMDENTQVKTPILIIDVNIGADKVDKIVVNEGEKIEIVCKKFVAKHGIILNRVR